MNKKIYLIASVIIIVIGLFAGYFIFSRSPLNNKEWDRRIDAALKPSTCPEVVQVALPASYYQGPLIDTHLHIPPLADDFFGDDVMDTNRPRGVDSDLYDEIAPADEPLLGRTVTIDQVACALKQEGTSQAFAFFPCLS